MTAIEQRIGRWLAALVSSQGLPRDEAVTFSLVHAAVDQTQRIVRTWRCSLDEGALATITGEINEEAGEDAAQMGGMQRYFLRSTLKGKEIGSIVLRYNADPDNFMPAVDSEPASARGLVAQAQRFTEAIMRIFVQGHGQVIETQSRVAATQQTMIDMFQKQQIEMLRLQQELAGRKLDQELALENQRYEHEMAFFKEEQEQKHVNESWATVLKYAPYVLSGGKIPIVPTADEQADARMMLATMDREAFEKWLADSVPEEKRAEVTALYEQVHASDDDQDGETATGVGTTADRSERRQQVVSLAEAIYSALPRTDLQALAKPVLDGIRWEALDKEKRLAVSQLANAAWTACGELPGASADQAGPHLWAAIVANAGTLISLVPAVSRGQPWKDLDSDQRLVCLRVANQALKSATAAPRDSDHGEPATGCN